ncbi:MAG: hypothetical protein A3C43_02410 [Candidatus Schekmanbacteria bacterium RIFCSPHIGHO2_02_FULL_38_11]|uniref:Cell division protein ZapA n=1 Tax=Candidatus Schekmanbacteria bacterium RIFCSPLOWO2_12_FULL_38_15 TaxID=1817883 RepID=A0A1F7SPG1_9BACT|nr:MAG: hypothetical protein A2043_08910 [Candidatus Schekmanbacteria bacterium GWA2_38_9]OGL48689.1 MAG: hypothetical protein A3C43_02410 [Candidatus Schekmanbacteria bacterium RIFCSPHIGHO2_02_FULL_38_11]OGL51074.1 MAG: hypothetical protein A3H37_08575 [Candidatus Schekmanbacteria bacterium RIFCSPLOWO2_02_FULL_38_14]OGL55074.1 MAG: hypothetical protein A3G31_02400 [Candidatus Schekmanbacteria bacterium RIFCSPLOWO2_12_FULL_38_15]
MDEKPEIAGSKARQIKVDILGKTYTLKGDSDSEYMEKVADYVNQKMKALSVNSEIVDSSKIAILTALNIADELFKAKDKLVNIIKTNEEKTSDILNRLDQEFRSSKDFLENP